MNTYKSKYQSGGTKSKYTSHIRNSRKGTRLNFLDKPVSYSTHLMSYSEFDGKYYVYPTLFQDEKGNWYERSGTEAYKEAKKRGEIYQFNTEKEAAEWAGPNAPWKDSSLDGKAGPGYQKGGLRKFFRTKKQKRIDEANEEILKSQSHTITNDGVTVEVGEPISSFPHEEFNSKWTNISNQIKKQQKDNSGKWRYAKLVGPYSLPYQLEQERLQSMSTDHPDYDKNTVGEFNALYKNKQNTQRYHLEQSNASQKKINNIVSGYATMPLDIIKTLSSDQVAQGINAIKGKEWNDPILGYADDLLNPRHGLFNQWQYQTGKFGDWNYGLSKPLKYTYNNETGNLETPLLSEDLNVRKNAQIESIIDNNYESNNPNDYSTDFSNKNELISDALNIENPYGAFAVNAFLDPTTWTGAGLFARGKTGTNLLNTLRGSGDDLVKSTVKTKSDDIIRVTKNTNGSTSNIHTKSALGPNSRTHPVRGGHTFDDIAGEYTWLDDASKIDNHVVAPFNPKFNEAGTMISFDLHKYDDYVSFTKYKFLNRNNNLDNINSNILKFKTDLSNTVKNLQDKGFHHMDMHGGNVLIKQNKTGTILDYKIIDPVGYTHNFQKSEMFLKNNPAYQNFDNMLKFDPRSNDLRSIKSTHFKHGGVRNKVKTKKNDFIYNYINKKLKRFK